MAVEFENGTVGSIAGKTPLTWRLADIPFHDISQSRVRDDQALFFVLASSSLLETGTDIHTRLLGEHFSGNPALVEWLGSCWRQEELQHGLALRTYVAQVWPEFDWETAFGAFKAEYSAYCTPEQLEMTPALELVARCMVETDTASLYKSLSDYTDEPVLKALTGLIRADEVRHYQYFLQHFQQHNAAERGSRWRVIRTLARRLGEIHRQDADCALRHVFRLRYPRHAVDSHLFRQISSDARALVVSHLPRKMVVKMAIRPLDLPVAVQSYLIPPVSRAMQVLFRST